MTHCVGHALERHLQYLGLMFTPDVWNIYTLLRRATDHKNTQSTFAGIVPMMAQIIGDIYNLNVIIETNPDFSLMTQANEKERKYVIETRQKITEGPGIFCGYFSTHALFWPNGGFPEPSDIWVLSIKFKEK